MGCSRLISSSISYHVNVKLLHLQLDGSLSLGQMHDLDAARPLSPSIWNF
jgi:hypothetical protein